jgi:hypothetical protein
MAEAGPGPDVVAPRRNREGYRIAPGGGHRSSHVQGESAEQAGGAEEFGERWLADVDLELRWRGLARAPPCPAALAVASFDRADAVIQEFQSVTPTRRDQQRRVSRVVAALFLFRHVLHDGRAAAGVRPQAHGRPRAEP